MTLFSCTIVLLVLAIGASQAKLRIDNQWAGGFQGAIEIPIPNSINGWKLEIRFSQPVSIDAWLGDLDSKVDDRTYIYRNKDWNAQFSSGAQFNFEFVANGGVEPSNLITVLFNGQTVDIGSQGVTIPAVSTARPTENTPNPTGSTPTFEPETPPTTFAPVVAPVVDSKYNYASVLGASLLFYEAQRAGKLPANNRLSWRGDSMLMDKGENGEDLTGGYFDAGDYVKFGFPMAAFTTLLAWGAIDYADAYTASGELENMRQAIRWSTDYFIKAHVSEREFYGQVGDGHVDHASWTRPEDWTQARPAWKVTRTQPGSELVGETAAALAAASMVFRSADPTYSSKLLSHARQLYDFANENRGSYSDSIANAANFYKSWSGYGDELAWAAAWLLRATNEHRYQIEVEKHFMEFGLSKRPTEFGWDNKLAGVQVLMAKLTQQTNYRQQAESFCNYIVRQAPRTPKGLVFIDQWGALRHAGNVAFVCLQAAEIGINTQEYVDFAFQQINYILGDSGRSYVIGFGNNYPQRPHHRSSSCPSRPAVCDWNAYNSASANPQLLVGALVGGPDKNDSYEDNRNDYVKNEVATDYNAGFQSAVAGLLHYQLKQ
uniref:Endoglucanase n=1 Tax=Adineta ricciae TaxID=249248 RepID=A0A0E3Z6Y9_ADIRI|nr:glycoside hydrolase 9 [Adineta ricciae]